jgi:formamidopyrimidine-DNA glycosylase
VPELPEVEVARRYLARFCAGRTVRRVVVHEARSVRPRGAQALAGLRGARFVAFDRRGKHLLLTLVRGRAPIGLWSHLGMTGKWVRRQPDEPPPRFSRVELHLDRGEVVHYADLRLFGRLTLVERADFASIPVLAALGPDPLHDGLDGPALAARIGRSRRPLKIALMDQTAIAGLGNIQVSEALHRAGLDPRRRADTLTAVEVGRLARSILASVRQTLTRFEREVLGPRASDVRYVEEPGTPNPFRVYGRAGERCPRCRQGKIARLVQGGRATFFCPRCQR